MGKDTEEEDNCSSEIKVLGMSGAPCCLEILTLKEVQRQEEIPGW